MNNYHQWKNRIAYISTGVIFFLIAILISTINLLPFVDENDDLMDFGSFYASGLKIENGENPYDVDSEYIFDIYFSRVGAGGKMPNLNPPISILMFRILPSFDPHHSLIVWQITSAVLYAITVVILAFNYKNRISFFKVIWAFLLAGFWHTLVLGQVYTLLLLFSTLGWVFLRKGRYLIAGVAIGFVVAIKPNFIFWPIFLAFSGYFATFIASAISSVFLSLIPLVLYGPGIYIQWFDATALRYETLIMPGNNSILGLISRFSSIDAGIAAVIISSVILLYYSRNHRTKELQHTEFVSSLGIITSLLASPISWTGYTILLIPFFICLKNWTVLIKISAFILVIPFAVVLNLFQLSTLNFIIFGWLYGWSLLFILVDFIAQTNLSQINRATTYK